MAGRPSALRRATIALAWRTEWPIAVVVTMAWVALAIIHAIVVTSRCVRITQCDVDSRSASPSEAGH